MQPADGTLGIPGQLELAKTHLQRVVDQEPSDQRVAGAKNQLDGFRRLDRSDDPGQYTEHAGFGATRHEAVRRRLRMQAAVTRTVRRREDGGLSFEAKNAAPRVGLSIEHARVIDEVSRG